MSVPDSDTVLLITRNGMGDAEPALLLKLINTNLKLLDEHLILCSTCLNYFWN